MEQLITALFLMLVGVVLLVVFFAPSIVAVYRKHHYLWVIVAINVVGGATGIGWLIAFVWAAWPRETAALDVFTGDLITNSADANRSVYHRLGSNFRVFDAARSAKQVFVFQNGGVEGPFSSEEVQARLESGAISRWALYCPQGSTEWKAIE